MKKNKNLVNHKAFKDFTKKRIFILLIDCISGLLPYRFYRNRFRLFCFVFTTERRRRFYFVNRLNAVHDYWFFK